MVYWTILFYQVYRNHAKSNGIKPLFFFEAKGLLSQPLFIFKNCDKIGTSLTIRIELYEIIIEVF